MRPCRYPRAMLAPFITSIILSAPLAAQGLTGRSANPGDVATLDGIIGAFYEVVSGPAGQSRDWARDSTLYTAGVRFMFQVGSGSARRWQAVDHATFAEQSADLAEHGFFEREVHRVVREFGGMAHVFSTYEWTSPTETGPQRGRGINSIELIFEHGRWWITYAQWAGEREGLPIPAEFLPGGR